MIIHAYYLLHYKIIFSVDFYSSDGKPAEKSGRRGTGKN